MSDSSKGFITGVSSALGAVECTRLDGERLSVPSAIDALCDLSTRLKASGGVLYFCGNGASGTLSSNLTMNWIKNGGVKAACFNDAASLSALGNDVGYDQVFAFPLSRLGNSGDVLVAIGTSGKSPNLLRAIEVARSKQIGVVTFSGIRPDNPARAAGDLNLYVPAGSSRIVECAHQVLLYAWLDQAIGAK